MEVDLGWNCRPSFYYFWVAHFVRSFTNQNLNILKSHSQLLKNLSKLRMFTFRVGWDQGWDRREKLVKNLSSQLCRSQLKFSSNSDELSISRGQFEFCWNLCLRCTDKNLLTGLSIEFYKTKQQLTAEETIAGELHFWRIWTFQSNFFSFKIYWR